MVMEKRYALSPNGVLCLASFDDFSPGSGDKNWALVYYKHGWEFSPTAEKSLKRIPLRYKLSRWILKRKGSLK